MRSDEPCAPIRLALLSAVFDDRRDVTGAVEVLVRHAAADRAPAPERRPFVDEQLLEHEVVAVEVEVVLGVRGRGLDRLCDVAGGVLGRELEVREGLRHLHPLDGVGDQARLARRPAYELLNRAYFHRCQLFLSTTTTRPGPRP